MQEPNAGRPDLIQLYAAFNARNIEAVLATLHPDVDWPNGWEGGRVHGRDAVREYWTRQWSALDPHVDPVSIEADETGRTAVDVHAVIRDLAGKIVAEYNVDHLYTFEAGLVRSMEIRERKE